MVRKEEELYKDYCFRKALFTLLKAGLWNIDYNIIAPVYSKMLKSHKPDIVIKNSNISKKTKYVTLCDEGKDRIFIIQQYEGSFFKDLPTSVEEAFKQYIDQAFGKQAQFFFEASLMPICYDKRSYGFLRSY